MNKRFVLISLPAVCLLTMANSECSQADTSDQIQRKQQEQIALQSTQAVGMPAIVNFQEKRVYKEILELRDTALSTITYITDMQGNLHKRCDSIGYGIPYATQYTNPQKIAYASSQVGVATLPQADPNGLFSPANAEGTWVLCVNPKTQKAAPVYIEDRITVSPFPLDGK